MERHNKPTTIWIECFSVQEYADGREAVAQLGGHAIAGRAVGIFRRVDGVMVNVTDGAEIESFKRACDLPYIDLAGFGRCRLDSVEERSANRLWIKASLPGSKPKGV